MLKGWWCLRWEWSQHEGEENYDTDLILLVVANSMLLARLATNWVESFCCNLKPKAPRSLNPISMRYQFKGIHFMRSVLCWRCQWWWMNVIECTKKTVNERMQIKKFSDALLNFNLIRMQTFSARWQFEWRWSSFVWWSECQDMRTSFEVSSWVFAFMLFFFFSSRVGWAVITSAYDPSSVSVASRAKGILLENSHFVLQQLIHSTLDRSDSSLTRIGLHDDKMWNIAEWVK